MLPSYLKEARGKLGDHFLAREGTTLRGEVSGTGRRRCETKMCLRSDGRNGSAFLKGVHAGEYSVASHPIIQGLNWGWSASLLSQGSRRRTL
jgi:hypothetical protein